MTGDRPPREYPVLQRPPRDFFTPVARPIAGLLYTAVLLAIVCSIGFGAHNLASRSPAMVEPPDTSTYARDYRDSAVVYLGGKDLEHVSIPVRLRDRDNLRRHVHQHIVSHGGALVIGHWSTEDPVPKKSDTDRDVPRNDHVYHVNKTYLALLSGIDRPPWEDPVYYAQWTREESGRVNTGIGPPDTYVRVKTKFLWFEKPKVRFLTILISAGISGGLALAIALSFGMYWSQQRSRMRYL